MRILKAIICLNLILLPAIVLAGGNTTNDSFNKAKRRLLKQVYYDHRETFYCGCPFTMDKKIIPSDKFSPDTKHSGRAVRVEWEHVVPAHAFGQSFKEWRDGDPNCIDNKGKAFKGRNCAQKVNMLYRYMQSDMYNLVPANGQINALRSNYSYAMIPGEPRRFGNCDMEIEDRKAEPRPEIRGDIARIYFTWMMLIPTVELFQKRTGNYFRLGPRKIRLTIGEGKSQTD